MKENTSVARDADFGEFKKESMDMFVLGSFECFKVRFSDAFRQKQFAFFMQQLKKSLPGHRICVVRFSVKKARAHPYGDLDILIVKKLSKTRALVRLVFAYNVFGKRMRAETKFKRILTQWNRHPFRKLMKKFVNRRDADDKYLRTLRTRVVAHDWI